MKKYTKVIKIGGDEFVCDDADQPIRRVAEYFGSSSRTKPTYEEGAREPDRLIEHDTGKVFVFDEDVMNWVEM